MRTPFANRRRQIIAAAVILFAAIIGGFVFSSSPSGTPTISFAGVEPRHGSAVGFWITNTTRRPVYLERFGVQIIRDGDWNTEYEIRPPFFADTNMPRAYPSPLWVAPGKYRKILVTPPTNTVWRAGLVYASESKGFRVLTAKIHLALVMRDLVGLSVTYWGSDRTNFSTTITNASPKP